MGNGLKEGGGRYEGVRGRSEGVTGGNTVIERGVQGVRSTSHDVTAKTCLSVRGRRFAAVGWR